MVEFCQSFAYNSSSCLALPHWYAETHTHTMNPTAVVSSRSYTYTYNPSLGFHTSPPHSPLSAFTFRLPFQPSLNTPLINPIHKSHTRFSKVCAAERDRYYGLAESPAKALRRVLELPGLHQGPACFDALSAKLVERAGFQYCFTSGMIVFLFFFFFFLFRFIDSHLGFCFTLLVFQLKIQSFIACVRMIIKYDSIHPFLTA